MSGESHISLDLRSLMKNLEATLDYFASIPERKELVYENDYHEVAIDPDGNVRSHLDERDSALAGCSEITSYVHTLEPGKILDFGCGLGWILSDLDDRWGKYGIEVSQFAANHASKYGKIFCGNYVDFQETNFDVVLMNHVIEHLPNPQEAITKIKTLLKPGGILIIGTPNFDSGAARRYGNNFRLLNDPTHISLFSDDSLRRFVRDNGFTIENVEYPFFDTPWFTNENLLRLSQTDIISPPFYGSFISIFARKI